MLVKGESSGETNKVLNVPGVKGKVTEAQTPFLDQSQDLGNQDDAGFTMVKRKGNRQFKAAGSLTKQMLVNVAVTKKGRQLHGSVSKSVVAGSKVPGSMADCPSFATHGKALSRDSNL